MLLTGETIDDLLYSTYEKLLKSPFCVESSRGISSELIASTLVLRNPLARISRSETRGKIFSAIGELLWYLSGSSVANDIAYYLPQYADEKDDYGNIFSAYGTRIHLDGKNQITHVVDKLKASPGTRRAVINIFNQNDVFSQSKDLPCTLNMQFFIRDQKLHMHVTMRSNDVTFGLPHDIFAFTMIQEIVAALVGIPMGFYYHTAGSLHLYEHHINKAENYIVEGMHPTDRTMPSIPQKNVSQQIRVLIDIEKNLRIKNKIPLAFKELNQYWRDFAYLLQVYRLFKDQNSMKIRRLLPQLSDDVYKIYLLNKIRSLEHAEQK